MQITGAYR